MFSLQLKKLAVRQANPTLAPTSFLWGAYCPDRYYYEVSCCLWRDEYIYDYVVSVRHTGYIV